MRLTIHLRKYNSTGSMAAVECDDREIEIAGGRATTAKRACESAAKALRDAADRFDALAKESEPYQCLTQKRINNKSAK